MSFCSDVGELLLGTRFKRLGDRFIQDMSLAYKSLDFDFEAAWFPFVYLLHQQKETSLTQMASDLEITHSAASQMATILEKKGIIQLGANADDGRKKILLFTPFGEELVLQLLPVWQVMEACIGKVLAKAKEMDLLEGIELIEDELIAGIISEKIIELLKEDNEMSIYPLSEIPLEERKGLESKICSLGDILSDETLVAKTGNRYIAALSGIISNERLLLEFIELESLKPIYSVGRALLGAILSRHSNSIVELTDPSKDLLQAVIDSGRSFMVNRSKT